MYFIYLIFSLGVFMFLVGAEMILGVTWLSVVYGVGGCIVDLVGMEIFVKININGKKV